MVDDAARLEIAKRNNSFVMSSPHTAIGGSENRQTDSRSLRDERLAIFQRLLQTIKALHTQSFNGC